MIKFAQKYDQKCDPNFKLLMFSQVYLVKCVIQEHITLPNRRDYTDRQNLVTLGWLETKLVPNLFKSSNNAIWQ